MVGYLNEFHHFDGASEQCLEDADSGSARIL